MRVKGANGVGRAIVLEQLDLLVDSQKQRLIPRDPSGPVYEIERQREPFRKAAFFAGARDLTLAQHSFLIG